MSVSIDKLKTPMQNLFALVNAGNGTNLSEGSHVTLGDMVAYAGPNGHNTKITATGIPEMNVSGSKDLYYSRVQLKGSSPAPAKNIHLTRATTHQQIQDAIIAGWGLVASEVEDITMPGMFVGSVNISAKADSVLYVGTDAMPLIWDDVPVGPAYAVVQEGAYDDNFFTLPAFPFDFFLFGKNLKEETAMGVCSNSFLTMSSSTAYQTATLSNPATWPKPAIVIGGKDRSMQRLWAGLTPQYTYKIRFEGHISYSGGVLNSPTMVWELEFFMDGTFTLYTLAPNPAQATAYYGQDSVWMIFDGTTTATHAYNGGQDSNFIIPPQDDTYLKFTPSDANGTKFSVVPRVKLSRIGTNIWFLSNTPFTQQMIVDKLVADYGAALTLADLEPFTIPDMSAGGVFEVTLTAKESSANWLGSLTVSLLLGDGQRIHDHLYTTMTGMFG